MQQDIDSDWFKAKLEENHLSMRDLAKRLDMNISSLSRTISGDRRMQLEEAKQIAHFLRAPVAEVMRHAGVAIDLDGMPTRIMLAAIIQADGRMERLKDPAPLSQDIIDKAQSAISRSGNGQIIAAQIRANEGPLSMWDDALVLFKHTDTVEQAAIGSLSMVRNRDTGNQGIVKVMRARKTGEATVQRPSGDIVEISMDYATPVIAIIP